MKLKQYSDSYRTSLDEMMKPLEMNNSALFDKVRGTIPNTLKVVGLPSNEEKQINCHGFAFDQGKWFHPFEVYNLIKNGNLVEIKTPSIGCIVLYIDDQREIPIIYHSAKYLGHGKVVSKWSNGPVLEHDIFNAPKSYRDNVKFYRLSNG